MWQQIIQGTYLFHAQRAVVTWDMLLNPSVLLEALLCVSQVKTVEEKFEDGFYRPTYRLLLDLPIGSIQAQFAVEVTSLGISPPDTVSVYDTLPANRVSFVFSFTAEAGFSHPFLDGGWVTVELADEGSDTLVTYKINIGVEEGDPSPDLLLLSNAIEQMITHTLQRLEAHLHTQPSSPVPDTRRETFVDGGVYKLIHPFVTGAYLFPAPLSDFWDALMDLAVVVQALPPYELLRVLAGDWQVIVDVQVGAVPSKLIVKVSFSPRRPRYFIATLTFQAAEGLPERFKDVIGITVRTVAQGEDTLLTYQTEGGMGPPYGLSRSDWIIAVNTVGALVKQTFAKLEALMQTRGHSSPPPSVNGLEALAHPLGERWGERETHPGNSATVQTGAQSLMAVHQETNIHREMEEPLAPFDAVAERSAEGTVLGTDVETGASVILSRRARGLSSYAIGAMGMGKTTLLLNLILSDIERGDGVLVLDPHGDLIHDIVCRVPTHREYDVILWEPFDTETPFGLNLFACHDVTDPNLVDKVCSQAIGTFYKLFYESWGPQMEDLLRVTFLTLIYNQDLPRPWRPTLAEIPRLLTDERYRAWLVSRVADEPVRAFWQHTYNPLKPHEQIEYHRSSLNKIRRFLLNKTIRMIVGQSENSISLRHIMDEGKILLVNLSKGSLGEDNSSLLGSILVGQLLTAALSRTEIPFAQRRPFHLVVDEYQNFATKTFTTLQTEARKFSIDTIVAHQTRSMLDEESRGATTAVGNTICFAVPGPDAQELAGLFDNMPPEPPIVRVEPIRTIAANPWDHLVRHGHRHARVNELVTRMRVALRPIPKRNLPDFHALARQYRGWYGDRKVPSFPIEEVRRFITEEDVRQYEELLNIYLYKRMQRVAEDDSALRYHVLGKMTELGPFYTTFSYYGSEGILAVDVGKAKDEFIVFWGEQATYLRESQAAQKEKFYNHLYELAALLTKEPMMSDSGQFQEVRDKPRLFSDVSAETANTLSTLKPYHALCRMIDIHGNRVQAIIKTYPAAPPVPAALEQVERIRQRSRAVYGHPRAHVEEELVQRSTGIGPQSQQRVRQPATEDGFWKEVR